MADIQVYKRTPAEQKLAQRRAKQSMRSQVMMFSLMIFLTLVSFSMVVAYQAGVAGFSKYFIIPMVMLFAAVQVALQLYYFMHMNEKGHGVPQMFMFTGALLGFLIPLTFVTIVWW
ncbi:cytochrome C oxidase subunit IV family protein [Sporosarcina sp. ACRSL]|uniref:cytochrome C oxidase subunit IV family protein n=1 Tax=Sporosarcina sp. ACRSL TaxID=2918215 RepID=UPI001EF6C4D6|nr:cytochrome C oxidase subunit IV family protein [Sporosarcina sp. ACRSL]MCG7342749.1 cytochrome C oxidase subunit IV family protein [Sporosarcina sp. ACRSL]